MFPLGSLSNLDELFLIDVYYKINNFASVIKEQFRLSKSFTFIVKVDIPQYTVATSITHSHAELAQKSTLNRVSTIVDNVYVNNEVFGGSIASIHSEMQGYSLLLRVANKSDYVYINNEVFGSALACTHYEMVSRTNKTY